MPVNHEIKSHLARLLATEDLVVEHKNVETACFDVHSRVLTLPMWEKASNLIYDLLVGHEVGHALFTPDEDWTIEYDIPQQFVNIVEDARIEKLMKRKYPGLAKTFYNGYNEFMEQDFFGIGDDDINKFTFDDKVNLHFKVGSSLFFKFKEREQEIIDLVSSCETFKDSLETSKILYEYCVEEENYCKGEGNDVEFSQELVEASENGDSESGDSEEGDSEEGDSEGEGSNDSEGKDSASDSKEKDSGENSKEKDSDEKKSNQNPKPGSGGRYGTSTNKKPEAKTAKSLEDAIKNLANNYNTYENVYVEIPELNLDTVIVPNSKIYDHCKTEFNKNIDNPVHETINKKYAEFKKSAQKEVNYLVKEFECRKSADSYARASTSKSGVLDCTRLHTYKYNEDLFKKITTFAEGKNHGLIFILDWSGSMSNVILDTVKQLYNLIWFCKKVNIPFEVYAFTNEWIEVEYDSTGAHIPKPHYEKKSGLLEVSKEFSLLNIFTSKVKNNILEEQLKTIFKIATCFTSYYYNDQIRVPWRMSLSGTPLNESLIALHQIIPKFQKEYNLQKVQCIVLTDGEGATLKYHVEIKREYRPTYIGLNSIPNDRSFLRDRKTGNTYKITSDYYDSYKFTDVLLSNLKDKFPTVNFIGMRIMGQYSAKRFAELYIKSKVEFDNIMNEWKKNKSFSIKSSGYHVYFGMSSDDLLNDVRFDISGDATKSQIRNAFKKSLNSKKLNKKILGEFVQLIA